MRKLVFLGLMLILGACSVKAQVDVQVSGPASASLCDTITLTNRIVNLGETLSGLVVSQRLAGSAYVYVPSNSLVLQGTTVLRSGAAADPDVNDGSNLVWHLSGLLTTGGVSHLLITEVMYNPTNAAPHEAYEWIELFNPTPNEIGLTNWSLRDVNPGQTDVLPTFSISNGEFVVIAASTSAFLAAHAGYTGRVFEVADGALGSGLNEFADGVFLRDGIGAAVDAYTYGAPPVPAGSSMERYPANEDTDSANDWRTQATPTPGTGAIRSGIGGGEMITIINRLEVTCGAWAGYFATTANFEQPPGTPGTNWGSMFLTIDLGDLTITKTPVLIKAGYHDPVVWNVTVRNEGFGKARNVVVTDTLGTGMEFLGFDVAPTNTPPYGQTVVWDQTCIPALSNMAPNDQVSLVVTSRPIACVELYNDVDARWGCSGFAVSSNQTCEDTAMEGETARATIEFIYRPPILSAEITPTMPFPVNYCDGAPMTITLTNVPSPQGGPAIGVELVPTLPAGFDLSGSAIGTNGHVIVGDIEPGAVTSVTVNLAPGDCSAALDLQVLVLQPEYTDLCGTPFHSPGMFTMFYLTNLPTATVSKDLPGQISGDNTNTTVTVRLAYEYFTNTRVRIIDAYPRETNGLLSIANIVPAGVNDGTNIIWDQTLSGSGVFTGRFDLVLSDPCAVPSGILANVLTAPPFTNCLGCLQDVIGSGQTYPVSFQPGAGCAPSYPGTGDCTFAAAKTVSSPRVEICSPVTLTQTFTNFSGPDLPSNNWDGVVFQSDLAGGGADTTPPVVLPCLRTDRTSRPMCR